jgi:hypothetical protein
MQPPLRASSLALGLALSFVPSGTGAVTPDQAALAEALFIDGKALAERGRHDLACPKLAESHRLDPGGGVVLALALCLEAQGKTASAWATFHEGLALARRDGDDNRVAVAEAGLARLEPRLSRLTVRVASAVAKLPGLAIRRDGAPLARPAWDLAVPVDPGPHVVEVVATAKRPLRIERHLGGDGDLQVVDIDELEDRADAMPGGSALREHSAARDASPSPLLPLGIAALSVGGVTFGVAGGLGWAALDRYGEADARCPALDCPDAGAVALSNQARDLGNAATITGAVGLALIASGVIMLIVEAAPVGEQASFEITPTGLRF